MVYSESLFSDPTWLVELVVILVVLPLAFSASLGMCVRIIKTRIVASSFGGFLSRGRWTMRKGKLPRMSLCHTSFHCRPDLRRQFLKQISLLAKLFLNKRSQMVISSHSRVS